MEHWLWIILAALLFECKGEDSVTQSTGDVTVTEGETVTLDCTFVTSSTNSYLFWYKQDGNNRPKFILRRSKFGGDQTEDKFKERFSCELNSTSRSVPLKIQQLQLSDSAVYYCAVRPGTGISKMIFGKGITLMVEDRETYEPSYYRVGDQNLSACLATGFSRHDAVGKDKYEVFNQTEAVRINDDSLYNQVSVLTVGQTCPDKNDGNSKCDDSLEPDPTVNLVSLTVLGLRLLFIKTIIFNVLLTFRLWISR